MNKLCPNEKQSLMADVLHVLLIEDDLVDRKAIERLVHSENLPYKCVAVTSIAQAKTALATQTFDIVLADYTMADGTALDVLNIVHDLPVIVITGTGNEETAVRAMKQGAYDYLVKDYDRNY
jgi:DNA-binding NtrC family response regulator